MKMQLKVAEEAESYLFKLKQIENKRAKRLKIVKPKVKAKSS